MTESKPQFSVLFHFMCIVSCYYTE